MLVTAGDVGEGDILDGPKAQDTPGQGGCPVLGAHSVLPGQLCHVWAPGGPAVTVPKGSCHQWGTVPAHATATSPGIPTAGWWPSTRAAV